MSELSHLPSWISRIVGAHIPASQDVMYITFDDGPDPESTPWLLRELENFQAKATFFCSGRQTESYPLLYRQILKEGHETGNHGFNHLNGWMTSPREYISDVEKASLLIDSDLFRPAYGKFTLAQWLALRKRYSIVLWDLLFRDYQQDFEPFRAFQQAKKFLEPGRIIVLHDSLSSFEKTKVLLRLILEQLKNKGISTSTLSGK